MSSICQEEAQGWAGPSSSSPPFPNPGQAEQALAMPPPAHAAAQVPPTPSRNQEKSQQLTRTPAGRRAAAGAPQATSSCALFQESPELGGGGGGAAHPTSFPSQGCQFLPANSGTAGKLPLQTATGPACRGYPENGNTRTPAPPEVAVPKPDAPPAPECPVVGSPSAICRGDCGAHQHPSLGGAILDFFPSVAGGGGRGSLSPARNRRGCSVSLQQQEAQP